jgi:hypothetical protein
MQSSVSHSAIMYVAKFCAACTADGRGGRRGILSVAFTFLTTLSKAQQIDYDPEKSRRKHTAKSCGIIKSFETIRFFCFRREILLKTPPRALVILIARKADTSRIQISE